MDDRLYLNEPWGEEPVLAELVYESLGISVSGSYEAILVLAALAGQVSYEEIFSIYGRVPISIPNKIMPKLVADKLLARKQFPVPDGANNSCFVMTSKGYSVAKGLIGNAQDIQKIPLRDGVPGAHAYAVGYNLYQLICIKEHFLWTKEAPYDNPYREGLSFKTDLSYRTDCNAIFSRNGRILHIEEDRANENASVLIDKVYRYYDKGCFEDPGETLLFSVRSAGVGVAKDKNNPEQIYSWVKCKRLMERMRECGFDDASAFLGREDLFSDQIFLRKLLLRLGYLDGRAGVLGLGELEEFYRVLKRGVSPFQQADFNRVHQNAAFNLARYFALDVIGILDSGGLDFLIQKLLRGRCVGFIPTSLLSSRLFSVMLSMFPDRIFSLGRAFMGYYGHMKFSGEISSPMYYGKMGEYISLRNGFLHDRGELYVEFPSCDACAWIRCRVIMQNIGYFSDEPFQVVYVFDSLSEAGEFFAVCGYSATEFRFDNSHFAMYAALSGDIMDFEARLYAPCGDGAEKEMMPV